MKFLIVEPSPLSILIPLGSKYSPQDNNIIYNIIHNIIHNIIYNIIMVLYQFYTSDATEYNDNFRIKSPTGNDNK